MSLSYLANYDSTADASTYTFSSSNIGVADSTRLVIVTVMLSAAAGSISINTVTIGGISATIHVQVNGGSGSRRVAVCSALVPTGETADIVVTTSGGNSDRCSIGVYRAAGGTYLVHDSATSGTVAQVMTNTLDVPAGGFLVSTIMGFGSGGSVSSVSWTNANEDFDKMVETNHLHSSAKNTFTSSQTNLVVTGTFDIAPATGSAMATVSWLEIPPPSGGSPIFFGNTAIA